MSSASNELVRKRAILGVCFAAALAIAAASLLSTHFRLALLTPIELKPKQPEAPPPSADDCSAVNRSFVQYEQSAGSIHKGPLRSAAPLSTDEIAIYKAVLAGWVVGEHGVLNVSLATYPVDALSPSHSISNCQCVKDIAVESLLAPSHSFHNLPSDVLSGNMRLVDAKEQAISIRNNDPGKTMGEGMPVKKAVANGFANGLFSLSEIAFDPDHHHALVSYSFRCGSLCGSGSTLMFEKIGAEWKRADRSCGGWIS
jgi:hypothetical protein